MHHAEVFWVLGIKSNIPAFLRSTESLARSSLSGVRCHRVAGAACQNQAGSELASVAVEALFAAISEEDLRIYLLGITRLLFNDTQAPFDAFWTHGNEADQLTVQLNFTACLAKMCAAVRCFCC